MSFDLVIRGGKVVDGTGLPAFCADVGIRDGRIVRLGRCDGTARREIDANGCVVAPGFIDVHTHYDVQLDWDPLASSSCWHGVTTVIGGNCGFGLAPARAEDVDWLAGMLSRVEGMSRAALREGLRFRGGSFGEYWQRFAGRIGVNVGSFVGHSPVRRFVMGDEASERAATAGEIDAMRELVRQAMREGALGFSTSQLDLHVGEDGRGVPSNHATAEEILALGSVLAEFDRGTIEIIPRSFADGYDDADRQLLRDLYFRSGRPVELNLLVPTLANPMGWQRTLEFVEEAGREGLRLYPQFSTNRLGLHLKLADTFVFDELDAWREALTQPEPARSRALRDPVVRARLQADLDGPTQRAAAFGLEMLTIDSVRDTKIAALVGRDLTEIARERELSLLEAFLDVSLEDGLETVWRTRTDGPAEEFIRFVNRAGIHSPVVLPGSSDGGAHLTSFVGADYTTRLLTDWVPGELTLEAAVHRLACMPAVIHGITDRGVLREGAWADVVIFDPARLAAHLPRFVRDFPADSERLVVGSDGWRFSIVNGEVLLEDGRHTGALPGALLRGI